jgi:hypothetical protein
MKELMYIRSFSKRRLPVIVGTLLLVIIGSVWLNTAPFRSGSEITDELGGNIFPSSILSVATTDAQVIVPVDSMYVGNPKSCIAVRVRSRNAYSRVRVEVAETPFFSRSVSEFVLAKPRTEYIIYPDIIWNYEALKNNNQAEPISVAVMVEMPVSWNFVPFVTYPNRHSLMLRTEKVRTLCPKSLPFISTITATLMGSAWLLFFRAS